ncbi:pikE, partial [Symbiodinium microadriaticum]
MPACSMAMTPVDEWNELEQRDHHVIMSEELFQKARAQFNRGEVVYLHHVVAVAFPELPTINAARKALRQGRVLLDGREERGHDTLAPSAGSCLTARLGSVDDFIPEVDTVLSSFNEKSERLEARIHLLHESRKSGWAVVNKPAGLHCRPCGFNAKLLTLEDYLPALVGPPLQGTHCKGPRACHRLDFRVAGPVVVATSQEAMRSIKEAFENRRVKKEYRAIVCGSPARLGKQCVSVSVDGEEATTLVEVLQTVPCPHYGELAELRLVPITGRHHQLRHHCAEVLGTPIVNEERPLFNAAAAAWEKRAGTPLPPYFTRGGGNLFLQAIEVSFPDPCQQDSDCYVTVRVPVSQRFQRLLRTSERAYNEGWRSSSDGKTYRTDTHGRFDGRQIRWGAEESWSRLDEPGEEDAFHKSVAMVRLIMPQLAAALRWELESSSPREAEQVDLEAQSEASAGRPLFNFLLGYASATKQPEVVSELYWALVCLCHQPNGGEALKAARIALLDALQAGGDDHFLQDCRRRVGGQCEVWRQHTALIQYHNKQSSSGGGNFHHRTTKLREVLRRWSVLRRALDLESFDLAAADAAILASPRSRPNHRAPAVGIDLVDPDTEMDHLFLSLPVDPSVRFEGTVVEKSAVLASKQAPLMLVCRTRHNQLHGSLAHSPATSPSRSNQAAGRHGEQVLEKYLLKVGDDLRQDQLVIQLMTLCNCIWRNHLPGQDARLVQLPLFRVLAVTPTSGYVKFVPDSTSLTEVLHQSRGDLGTWLVEHTPPGMNFDQVMDNFCGTVAAGCVASYVLGLGDRHLENICITKQGQFFHIDFGYFLGEDPKPFAPQVRLPAQVAQALLASKRIHQLYTLTRRAYLALRPFGTLFAGLLNLEVDNGQRYGRLAKDAESAISGMLERLRIDQEDDERAAAEFLAL